MPWAPRPDPSLLTGNLDTTDTAGVTARQGHIEQVSGVFELAEAVDTARRNAELGAGQLPEHLANTIGSQPRPHHYGDGEAARWEALAASQRARAQLAARGLVVDEATGQVVRTTATAPPGSGMGTMMTVDEGTT